MDNKKRKQLIKEIKKQEEASDTSPVVSLEDFFEGNDDEGSIGCNLMEYPGTDKFYKVLKAIRDNDNVQDVLVEIYEYDEDDDDYWPFSERVYIFASTELKEVQEWLIDLEISDVCEGYSFDKPDVAPELKPGYKVYSVWWD